MQRGWSMKKKLHKLVKKVLDRILNGFDQILDRVILGG